MPQDPLPVTPLIEEPVLHIPIFLNAINMNPIEPVAPDDGLLLLPQAPVPLLGSLFGLQGVQDAQEI
ncbi:hypothetical protein FRC09_021000 [Ceratobasidium sp. 395]|nr:hypothetical protein FRC09_021000 [Ceratobasidium sp. 395]